MSLGTKEGTKEEVLMVKELNRNKNSELWDILHFIKDRIKTYAIHVIHHQVSKITNRKVKPKADVILASGFIPVDYLEENGFYLSEDDMEKYKLSKIARSGISVKRRDSSSYQIHKFPPNTFNKIFGNYELGAGMSIYCKRAEELSKNYLVIKGWKTTWDKFERYFRTIPDIELLKDKSISSNLRLAIAKKVKNYSKTKIENDIRNNKDISNFIFKGIEVFEEPYSVHWLYVHGDLKADTIVPFYVTTGSGRSRGDFTVVIKPKKGMKNKNITKFF